MGFRKSARCSRRPSSLVAISSLLVAATSAGAAVIDAPFLLDGTAGFVFADIKFALADDADKTGACPQGMSRHVDEIFAVTAAGKRRPGEKDEAYAKRLGEGGRRISTAANGQNLCANPEAGAPDPNFRTAPSASLVSDGIDLDSMDSRLDGKSAGVCPHQDLIGRNGERGIDNQLARVVGCSRSYQSTGLSNSFTIEMLTGSWGILLALADVQDIRNDDSVEVTIVANADPIQLSAARSVLPYATYAMDQDPRFRGKTRGRLKDSVLTTEPVDVRFHSVVNALRFERLLLRARVQATLSADGTLNGSLAGYTPVEAMYDVQFGFRSGKEANGELASAGRRLGTANGAARVLGYTCPGAYFALYEYADADPDAQTGRCTSISTQYLFSAVPAFVVDARTEGVNDKLNEPKRARDRK